MRLSAKLRISYVGIVLLAVFIVLVLVIENAQRDLKEKIGHDLQTVSSIESQNIGEYVRSKITDIKEVSRAYVFAQADPKAIGDYLELIKREDAEINSIAAVTPEGEVIAAALAPAKRGGKTKLEISPLLLEEVAKDPDNGVRMQYGYTDKTKSMVQAVVIAPARRKFERNVNVLIVAAVDLSQFVREVASFEDISVGGKPAHLLANSSTMIITQDGTVQRFEPLVYLQENSPLKLSRKASREGYTIYRESTGEKVIAGFAKLMEIGAAGDTNWSVISMAPQKEVFSPAERLRNKMIILGVIVVFAAWVISFLIAKGITGPLRKLVRVTEGIANGALARRADIKLDDEVGDLARSFNKMTDKLNEALVLKEQEIIERRNAEEDLREEMKAKTDFIDMISREFKTPLVAIKEGLARILADSGGKLDEHDRQVLEVAQKSGESLSRLVSDIVNFHRIETEEISFKMESNHINDVVDEVQKTMLPLIAEKKGVQLLTKKDDELPKAEFDKEKVALALTNLVNVAVRATEEGSVTITTEKEGFNAIKVSVTDAGEGLDHADLSKIFDKFESAGKKRDKEAGGSGMGLAISKEIIEHHNGKIWAEPAGEKGVKVSFIIPITERRERA